jgi:hypothetical protein
MKRRVQHILRYYGATVGLVIDGQCTTVRAFFQPVTQKSLQNMRGTFTGLGEVLPGQYLYLGPAEPAVRRGDRIRWDGRWFDVRQAEDIREGDTTLFRWGLAVPGGEEDPWN